MSECVFITGATGLLGKLYVEEFLKNDYVVVYTSSSQRKIQEMCKLFHEYVSIGKLHSVFVDLESDEAIGIIIEWIEKKGILPDYLINNARSIKYITVDDYKLIEKEKWLGEYLLDVVVPYKLMIALSSMKGGRMKSIVNVASMYGFLPYNDYLCEGSDAICINYGVCKAALIQLSREMAVRLAPKKIRVNSVSYGGVEGRADNGFKARYARLCPTKKMLERSEISGHMVYLCSSQSEGMTGHNLVVDGGFSVW